MEVEEVEKRGAKNQMKEVWKLVLEEGVGIEQFPDQHCVEMDSMGWTERFNVGEYSLTCTEQNLKKRNKTYGIVVEEVGARVRCTFPDYCWVDGRLDVSKLRNRDTATRKARKAREEDRRVTPPDMQAQATTHAMHVNAHLMSPPTNHTQTQQQFGQPPGQIQIPTVMQTILMSQMAGQIQMQQLQQQMNQIQQMLPQPVSPANATHAASVGANDPHAFQQSQILVHPPHASHHQTQDVLQLYNYMPHMQAAVQKHLSQQGQQSPTHVIQPSPTNRHSGQQPPGQSFEVPELVLPLHYYATQHHHRHHPQQQQVHNVPAVGATEGEHGPNVGKKALTDQLVNLAMELHQQAEVGVASGEGDHFQQLQVASQATDVALYMLQHQQQSASPRGHQHQNQHMANGDGASTANYHLQPGRGT